MAWGSLPNSVCGNTTPCCIEERNKPTNGIFPSSPRRGGCAGKKMLRSLRNGADGVVAHKSTFKNAFRNLVGERPPRPLHQRWLRDFSLMSRPPLLGEEGNMPRKNFT